MNLEFSEADIKFGDEVRAWIKEAFDPELREMMAHSKNRYLDKAGMVRWMKKLYARGWIAPDWAEEYGGPGWTPTQRYIFQRETAAAGCPLLSPFGLKMVGHVIMKFGTEAQKKRFLPQILSSDVLWCQGYSEPGAGSDLASLQTRAERDGDHYIVNGSKIWTTQAHWADWIFCLVRTSKEANKQDGISFLLFDMRTPGITISPLPLLDGPMDGQQEVNQVFFENVRVPVENLVGEEGKGWTCAKYLLQFERGAAAGPMLLNQLNALKRIAAQETADDGGRLIDDADFRRKYAELSVRVAAVEATELRVFSSNASGKSIGAMSSLIKLVGSELNQAITELSLDAVGPYAQPFVRDTWAAIQGRPPPPRPGPAYAAPIAPIYFNFRKTSIYAGSSEVQHNILAKQVLGL